MMRFTLLVISTLFFLPDNVKIFEVQNNDPIMAIHFQSLLKKHRFKYDITTGLRDDYCIYDCPPDVQSIFYADAPEQKFGFHYEARGEFEIDISLSSKRWKSLTPGQLRGVRRCPFPLARLIEVEKVFPKAVSVGSYAERPYIGLDLKKHIGFDVKLGSGYDEREFQILIRDGKLEVIDKSFDGTGFLVLGPAK